MAGNLRAFRSIDVGSLSPAVPEPRVVDPVSELRVVDPVLELVGWKREPLLLKRLAWYLTEGILEWVTLAAMLHMKELHLSPPAALQRLAVMPLGIVTFRICWAIGLLVGYYSIRGADVHTAIKRLSCLHRRNCWSCSQVMYVASSCVLMVWYIILLLLIAPFSDQSADLRAVWFIGITVAFFLTAHWVFWRDFVRNYDDQADSFDARPRLIFNMYRKREIRLAKHGALVAAAHIGPEAAAARLCAICLEDFQEEDIVSQLPCGHIFHPTCAHRWICENWRCPLRCALVEAPKHDRLQRPAWALEVEARPGRISAQAARAEADPELGIVPTAPGDC